MNTKVLMTLSSIFLAATGIYLLFLPQEAASYLNLEASEINVLILKILSATVLGFAFMNWMARGNLIGGIYSRPVAIGNFMHFFVGAVTLLKWTTRVDANFELFLTLTIIYCLLAGGFGYVFMANPSRLGDID